MTGPDRMEGYYQPDMECMSAEERAEYQLARVRGSAVRACERSSGTRAKFGQAGLDPTTISSLEDLRKLPLTRKREFPAVQKDAPPFGGFNTVDIGKLGHVFVSPGPIYDPEGTEEDFWLLRKAFYTGGFRAGDIVFLLNCFLPFFTS